MREKAMATGERPRVVESQTVNPIQVRSTRLNRLTSSISKNLIWYLFLTPAVIMILAFMAMPLLESLQLAFVEWNGLAPPKFVGIENFTELTNDRFFWGALWHTLAFAGVATLGTVLIGLLLAVVISRGVWGASVYRVVYYLPVMLPMTVTGALWARIYENNYGLLNTLLRTIGLDSLASPWLGDINLALWAIVAVSIWQFSGFPMIVLLAAIENISQDIHEAATLDGVNEWQRLRFLILPLIRPVLFSISMLQLIFSLKVFDLVWIMTKGGPGESSTVLGTYLYRKAFELHSYGYASAVAVVMFVAIFAITYAYQRLIKVDVVEQ
jgi:ABC-type sugar transport system permease subunit